MDGRGSRQESIANRIVSGAGAKTIGDAPDRKRARWHREAGPVVEISDKDYRSFGLPCDALEERGDSEQGE